jgi:hypothetical protein
LVLEAQMFNLLDYPLFVLAASLTIFWISAWTGAWFATSRGKATQANHDDFAFVLGGTLTLLGLIIGFTFSMAVNRYDQRKNYEAEEANAIGTEYTRASLLPTDDAMKLEALLKSYLGQRILCYRTHSPRQLQQIDAQTARLQTAMWSSVVTSVGARPTPVTALALSGMNDVLNSQGYAQAAHRNRIPTAAWILLASIAVFCNLLIGFGAQRRCTFVLLILPIALSISLFLISDIDSPRRGVIHVEPQNLESLAASLQSR